MIENSPVRDTGDMSDTVARIPIRNLWHMLLYAWNQVATINRWQAEVEDSPTIDALLASMLAKLIQQRLRIGLGRNYATEASRIRGLRGRVDFAETLRTLAFENGQAHCRYQSFSYNVPKNQIVRSTLARLVQVGQFGASESYGSELRHTLRRLVRDLEAIDVIEVTPDTIGRQELGRNDSDYRLMLDICNLLLKRQMPTESSGTHPLPGLDRDALTLYHVYEQFVANFYKHHLTQWNVTPQKKLAWHARQTSRYMPIMAPDLVLTHRTTSVVVVLDTKFTANSLITTQWGKDVFNSAHLYQLYTYLRSQESIDDHHRCASGILLYPTVTERLSEIIELQGHLIHLASVSLFEPWDEIEKALLAVVTARENPSLSP